MQVDGRAGVLIGAKFASGVAQAHAALTQVGTVSVNPPNIATADTSTSTTVTITGTKVGDIVFLIPPDTIEDGLIFEGAAVTSAGVVTISLRNVTVGALDGAAREWAYLVFSKTEP